MLKLNMKPMASLMAAIALLSQSYAQAEETSYQLPEQRLEQKAGRSTELYVDPAFNFQTQQQVTLDLLVLDSQGEPIANQLVFVAGSSVDGEAFSRLAILRTGETGALYQQLEIGSDIVDLEISVPALGIENRYQTGMQPGLVIQHTFE